MTDKLSLREADLAWRTVDDELIAIDVRESTYLSANGSGLLMWNMLAGGTTRAQLVASLVDAYGIEADTASTDVDAFLADLRERGLLDEADTAD